MRTRWWFGMAAAGAFGLATTHSVDLEPTQVDRAAISPLLEAQHLAPQSATASIGAELRLIRGVQRAVLAVAPVNRGIPQGQSREPAELFARGEGLCFDRSRAIEKSLRTLGFRCRHIFVYSTEDHGLLALFYPGVRSHAITEVLTQAGWLVVDSNQPWLSLDESGSPVSLTRIQMDVEKSAIRWPAEDVVHQSDIYRRPFSFVYGLYSRHGRFYPPYDPIPDLNWSEVWGNVVSRDD